MKTEAFKIEFPIGASNPEMLNKLSLAAGDQVSISMDIMDEDEKGFTNKEVCILTSYLGLVTLIGSGSNKFVAMQHHLVNNMEEVAEDFADVVAEKADESIRAIIKHECNVEDWEVDHILIHFKERVRHAIWEKMDAPEPVFRKAAWWRRIRTKIKQFTRESYDERRGDEA